MLLYCQVSKNPVKTKGFADLVMAAAQDIKYIPQRQYPLLIQDSYYIIVAEQGE